MSSHSINHLDEDDQILSDLMDEDIFAEAPKKLLHRKKSPSLSGDHMGPTVQEQLLKSHAENDPVRTASKLGVGNKELARLIRDHEAEDNAEELAKAASPAQMFLMIAKMARGTLPADLLSCAPAASPSGIYAAVDANIINVIHALQLTASAVRYSVETAETFAQKRKDSDLGADMMDIAKDTNRPPIKLGFDKKSTGRVDGKGRVQTTITVAKATPTNKPSSPPKKQKQKEPKKPPVTKTVAEKPKVDIVLPPIRKNVPAMVPRNTSAFATSAPAAPTINMGDDDIEDFF